MPSNSTVQGEPLYDVRIVERYGRSRTLAQFNKVTKSEGKVLLGSALIAGHVQSGERVWVQPRVQIKRRGTETWIDQRLDITGTLVKTYNAWKESSPIFNRGGQT